jgi:tricarballylate dehydrogenase
LSRKIEKSDVLVVGSGLAGLSAGLAALEGGSSVVMLEKMDEARSGGNTRFAGGTIAVPRGDSSSDKSDYYDDFLAKAGGRCNRKVIERLADNALGDLAWLGGHGVRFDPATPIAPYRVNAAHVAPAQFVGMPIMLDTLREAFVRNGGKIAYQTQARRLVKDGAHRIGGVQAAGPAGEVEYVAGATVFATGGYTANAELLREHVDPNAGSMAVRGVEWATGDGLLMARDAGAGVTHMEGLESLHVAAVIPQNPRHGIPDHAVPYCISVNIQGRRFHDESKGYVVNGKAILKQPGQRIALIFDQEILQQQRVSKSFATFRRLGFPIVEADSLPELAARLDMPAESLLHTIEEFNAAVSDERALSAEPPKAALAFRIRTPKFYAFYPLIPGVTSSFGGLMIDGDARVLEVGGQAIEGLYAAGEVTGGIFYGDYIGGSALVNCMVMGRRAGAQASDACH